jgi:hypothetical protein
MPVWPSVFPIFSWINFTVSDLTLRFLIHFELMLVQGERLGPSFCSAVKIQFCQHYLLKGLSFFPAHVLGTFVKNQKSYVGLCQGLLFYSIGLHVCFCAVPCCFYYYGSVV